MPQVLFGKGQGAHGLGQQGVEGGVAVFGGQRQVHFGRQPPGKLAGHDGAAETASGNDH
jgi:hypothetical protein